MANRIVEQTRNREVEFRVKAKDDADDERKTVDDEQADAVHCLTGPVPIIFILQGLLNGADPMCPSL